MSDPQKGEGMCPSQARRTLVGLKGSPSEVHCSLTDWEVVGTARLLRSKLTEGADLRSEFLVTASAQGLRLPRLPTATPPRLQEGGDRRP